VEHLLTLVAESDIARMHPAATSAALSFVFIVNPSRRTTALHEHGLYGSRVNYSQVSIFGRTSS